MTIRCLFMVLHACPKCQGHKSRSDRALALPLTRSLAQITIAHRGGVSAFLTPPPAHMANVGGVKGEPFPPCGVDGATPHRSYLCLPEFGLVLLSQYLYTLFYYSVMSLLFYILSLGLSIFARHTPQSLYALYFQICFLILGLILFQRMLFFCLCFIPNRACVFFFRIRSFYVTLILSSCFCILYHDFY